MVIARAARTPPPEAVRLTRPLCRPLDAGAGTVSLPLLADQGCQVTALIGRDDADSPRISRRHGHIPLSRMSRGGLVLLLMANGGALPGAYRAAA
jgi:hypothetical protein